MTKITRLIVFVFVSVVSFIVGAEKSRVLSLELSAPKAEAEAPPEARQFN